MYVVRDTYHPAEDLKRNWSAPMGGFSDGEMNGCRFQSAEDAATCYERLFEKKAPNEFRFHPAYNSFVEVHYEGLGAWALNAETIEEAINEAAVMGDGLACTMESGSGHFFAEDVISFHEVCEGRYIFELK